MKDLSKEQIEYAVARLRAIVESRKVTQAQLQQWSSVHQSTISKILSASQENGGEPYTPSEDVLKKLFRALGLTLAEVLTESDRVAEEILGYLATPLTGLCPAADEEIGRIVDRIRRIACDSEVFNSPPFELYWPGEHTHPLRHADISPDQVYITDRSRASTHDFIILFCGSPSYGVGQENEIATQAGIPAIRLIPSGISRMMAGSFLRATNIKYSGTLATGVTFDPHDLRNALTEVRKIHFSHLGWYRGMNGNSFGSRLHKLIGDRCGSYDEFARDLGISLSYLHTLIKEPFAVSNPSARLLKRIACRLSERVSFLLGESEENDPVWTESNLSWRAWIDKTSGVDARIALRMRDEWRDDYASHRRSQQTSTSFRKPTEVMREPMWDRCYQQFAKEGARNAEDAKQASLL